MGTYVITGATRGIGRAVVEQLADHRLVLVGRDSSVLDGVAANSDDAGTVLVDLAEPESIAQLSGWPERIDGVVHAAGVLAHGRVAHLEVADWDYLLRVNLVAVAELTRVLLPGLRAAGGTVVMVNSGQGLVAGPMLSAYAATKHALKGLADSLRLEEPDIRVVSVYPGRTATDMQRGLRSAEQAPYEPDNYIRAETVAEVIVNALMTPPDGHLIDVNVRSRPRSS